MIYTLDLFLDMGKSSRMDLMILDRYKNILPMQIEKLDNNWQKISCQITMPNKILMLVTGKDYSIDSSDKFLELKGVTLGGIRIKQKMIKELCEFKSDDGVCFNRSLTIDDYLKFESARESHWDRNGCAILELFDQDPIRYHLNLGTTI